MNIYLKSAVQNLDAHIAQVTEIRNRLADGLGPEIGKDVFPPASAEATARQAGTVQTLEPGKGARVSAEVAVALASGKRLRKLTRKQNGGGRKVRTKTEAGGQKSEGGATEPVVSEPGAFKPSTLSGSMKLEISRLKEFTLEELQTIVDEKYREEEFHKNAATNSFYANLMYWAKTGRLEKSGDGAKAMFKVLDKEFFSQVEFKT